MSDSELTTTEDAAAAAQRRAREIASQFMILGDQGIIKLSKLIEQALSEKPTFNIIESKDVEHSVFLDTSALTQGKAPQAVPSETDFLIWYSDEIDKTPTDMEPKWRVPSPLKVYRYLASQFRPSVTVPSDEEIEAAAWDALHFHPGNMRGKEELAFVAGYRAALQKARGGE